MCFFCKSLALMIVLGCLLSKAQKPANIIFILADDHRYDAMASIKERFVQMAARNGRFADTLEENY